jgi:hypothetical protein
MLFLISQSAVCFAVFAPYRRASDSQRTDSNLLESAFNSKVILRKVSPSRYRYRFMILTVLANLAKVLSRHEETPKKPGCGCAGKARQGTQKNQLASSHPATARRAEAGASGALAGSERTPRATESRYAPRYRKPLTLESASGILSVWRNPALQNKG